MVKCHDAMMRALILLHRWLGVTFCVLFAMWFASGIIMHFVPYPAMTEAERFAGLAPLDVAGLAHGPAEAVAASRIAGATRVRLLQRSDGPVYLVANGAVVKALHAADLADATVGSRQLALAIATDYAGRRHLASAAQVERLSYDQWTVAGGYNRYRPLFRIALGDDSGTELYVSSTTGEVVLTTARREREWNYVGSVPHWIYPTALRSHPATWSALVWWLSLVALIGATAGAVVSVMRIEIKGGCPQSPYRGWQAWHHWLGVCCMLFVWSWIFSGWLSMDSGQLFSLGRPTIAENIAVSGRPDWNRLPADGLQRIGRGTKEVEWFGFGGQIYRRERFGAERQRLVVAERHSDVALPARAFLSADEVNAVAAGLAPQCNPAVAVTSGDAYAPAPSLPGAPMFRLVCGDRWYELDGASGLLVEKLDASRRAYRWLYEALHTFDIPALSLRPALRTALIVGLCGCGFVFSVTGVVIAWRRLRSCFE
jgi:PepSY-associated TM region